MGRSILCMIDQRLVGGAPRFYARGISAFWAKTSNGYLWVRLSMSRLEDDAKKDHVLSKSFNLLRHGVSTGDESGPSAPLAVPPPESLAQETKRLKLQETLGGCHGRGCCWVCSFWWGGLEKRQQVAEEVTTSLR